MTHQEHPDKRKFNIQRIIGAVLLVGLAAFGVFRLHAHRQLKQRIDDLYQCDAGLYAERAIRSL